MKKVLTIILFVFYPIGMLILALIVLVDELIYKHIQNKGKWLPDSGRYANLEPGQYRASLICKFFGHDFVDPRIVPEIKAKESQKWEKCTRCGKEQPYEE